MNPFDPDIFSAENPCVCCGGPTECACALFIPPPPNAPYADYATAESIISNPLIVADCLAYFDGLTTNISSFSASFSGTALVASISMITPVGGLAGPIWFNVTGNSGDIFTVSCTGGTVLGASLYDCAGTLVESISGSTPRSFSALAVSGNYYLKTNVGSPFPPTPFSSATVTVTSSGTFVPNPIIALWDDSGTTRQLEACPKMLIPPLTESTGTWYMTCADAAGLISSNTDNCIGYWEGSPTPLTFSASGTTSVTLAETFSSPAGGTSEMWCSINAVAGATLTATPTGFPNVIITVYDYAGILVDSVFGSGARTTISLPYTGRYILKVGAFVPPPGAPSSSGSVVITSSSAISVNPIQALYGDGTLLCPNRLNCGDSCP